MSTPAQTAPSTWTVVEINISTAVGCEWVCRRCSGLNGKTAKKHRRGRENPTTCSCGRTELATTSTGTFELDRSFVFIFPSVMLT